VAFDCTRSVNDGFKPTVGRPEIPPLEMIGSGLALLWHFKSGSVLPFYKDADKERCFPAV